MIAQPNPTLEVLELAWAWLVWFDGGDEEPVAPVRDVLQMLEREKQRQAAAQGKES